MIAALFLASPAKAQGVVDGYSPWSAAVSGYTPQAIDCASSAYIDLGATGLSTSSTEFTFGAAFEVAASPADGALFYRASSDRTRFWWNSDGTIEFYLKDNTGTVAWQWQSSSTFSAGTKGAILLTYSKNTAHEVWIDGSAETGTDVTLSDRFVDESRAAIVCSGYGSTDPWNGRMGSLWYSNVYADIDTTEWAKYFDGSGNPKNSANGADIWLNWSDYADHGSIGVTVTNHGTSEEDW